MRKGKHTGPESFPFVRSGGSSSGWYWSQQEPEIMINRSYDQYSSPCVRPSCSNASAKCKSTSHYPAQPLCSNGSTRMQAERKHQFQPSCSNGQSRKQDHRVQQPVPALMFKRLAHATRNEQHPVQDSGPSCSHSPPMPQPPSNHAGRSMGSPYFPYRWWSMGPHRKWTAFRS